MQLETVNLVLTGIVCVVITAIVIVDVYSRRGAGSTVAPVTRRRTFVRVCSSTQTERALGTKSEAGAHGVPEIAGRVGR